MKPGTYNAYRSVTVFSALDGLRALSVLAVVWHHSPRHAAITSAFPASRYGFLGVDLFFMISGFLIVTLLMRERERRGSISLRNFYARRALRIFPLYYGLLGAFALLYYVVRPTGSGAAAFRAELWVMALYLSNWLPVSGMFAITWSLAVEEQFYAFWPPIEKWLSRWAVVVILAVIALSQLIHFGVVDPLLAEWFGWSPDEPAFLRQTTFTPICLGVLLAHVLHYPLGFRGVARWLGGRSAAPMALLALVIVTNLLPDDIRGSGRVVAHVAMLVLLASTVVREDNGLRSLLVMRGIARVGVLSYGIYLLHHVALGIVARVLEPLGAQDFPVLGFVLGAAAATGLAELSYRFYESRLLALRSRFR